jgi:hypothetical protein
MWTLFVTASSPGLALSAPELEGLRKTLAGLHGLEHGRIMVPDMSPSDQPFAADGRGPDLALQLDFDTRAAADVAMADNSPLSALSVLHRMAPCAVSHQLMRGRRFPTHAGAPADPSLTFLVTFPGPAENQVLWLDHYDLHHPPIMVRFPRIREVETYRQILWSSALPFARDAAMQRNTVVFDSLADLIAALASPVMLDMRADGKAFPPYAGKTTHFPMTTWSVRQRGG